MSNKKNHSYLLNNIDKDIWRQFKATALMRGFDSAGGCLRAFIEQYNKGDISVKR
tara:strand:+ start:877 stop:1041 length:165 start_codon:yes stop_codon:yes gene_type:complete